MWKIILLVLLLLAPKAMASEHPLAFGFHIGYSPSYLVMMTTSGNVGTVPYSDSFIMEYEKSPEVGLTLWRMPRNDWGFQIAADFGSKRKLEKLTIDGQTLTPQPGQEVATYQTHFIRFGAAYRWDVFYIPVGLTYGITAMTTPSSGTLEVKGGVGMYYGIGWNFDDTIAIEYIGRSAMTEYTHKSGTNTENGQGVIGSALLNLKILF